MLAVSPQAASFNGGKWVGLDSGRGVGSRKEPQPPWTAVALLAPKTVREVEAKRLSPTSHHLSLVQTRETPTAVGFRSPRRCRDSDALQRVGKRQGISQNECIGQMEYGGCLRIVLVGSVIFIVKLRVVFSAL